jgi:hypothetical protein
MFKRVDEQEPRVQIDGFSYMNTNGSLEYVHCGTGIIEVEDSSGGKAVIWREDVPKLILALQAAYDHKG